jgi:hypothetical protein
VRRAGFKVRQHFFHDRELLAQHGVCSAFWRAGHIGLQHFNPTEIVVEHGIGVDLARQHAGQEAIGVGPLRRHFDHAGQGAAIIREGGESKVLGHGIAQPLRGFAPDRIHKAILQGGLQGGGAEFRNGLQLCVPAWEITIRFNRIAEFLEVERQGNVRWLLGQQQDDNMSGAARREGCHGIGAFAQDEFIRHLHAAVGGGIGDENLAIVQFFGVAHQKCFAA